MKRFALLFVLLFLTGCATTTIPRYIRNENPYKKTFYAEFEQVQDATRQTLEDLGWTILESADPSTFERDRVLDTPDGKQTLIFTDVRQTSMFIGTRYHRLNIYLQSKGEKTTEVEIRYLTLTTMFFKTFESHKSDAAVNRIFQHIEELLQ